MSCSFSFCICLQAAMTIGGVWRVMRLHDGEVYKAQFPILVFKMFWQLGDVEACSIRVCSKGEAWHRTRNGMVGWKQILSQLPGCWKLRPQRVKHYCQTTKQTILDWRRYNLRCFWEVHGLGGCPDCRCSLCSLCVKHKCCRSNGFKEPSRWDEHSHR